MEATALEKKWAQEATEQAAREAAAAAAEEAAKAEHIEQGEAMKERLPRPTGWRIVVLPYRGARKSKGGIELADQTIERQQLTTTCAYVLSVGPLAGEWLFCPTEERRKPLAALSWPKRQSSASSSPPHAHMSCQLARWPTRTQASSPTVPGARRGTGSSLVVMRALA